jgi:hypothetical protein
MALLHVMQQILEAFGNALALGLDGFLLRFGIQRHEVAGGRGCGDLLHGKADAGTGFVVGFDRLGQLSQRLGVQQVRSRRKSGGRVGRPGFVGKAAVGELMFALGAVGPEFGSVCQKLLLQLLQFCGRKFDLGGVDRGCHQFGTGFTEVHVLKRRKGFAQAFGHGLL